MRLIDADKMSVDELAAFISAQAKIIDAANRDINSIVHEKIQRLIADTPTVEDAVHVVRCKDCIHFEYARFNSKDFLICPNTRMDIWDECYCAHGEKRIIDNDVAEQCPECSNEVATGTARRGECKNDKNVKTTETAEPQPDGIQFRTVDDLGRICIPKDIRDKLGLKPGTECAVYATDELISDEIIVIRRSKNEETP